jgi:hypothetical protein
MATRRVSFDDEAEVALAHICKTTGLEISAALKLGLRTLQERLDRESSRTPYDVYRQLDPGPGGYLIAPSTETRQGVRRAIRSKLHR